MSEPKRWILKAHSWSVGGDGYEARWGTPSIAVDTPGLDTQPDIPVREDRATEVDREKIALRLAEHAARELDLEVEVFPHHLETADELLALVFGEEASRV